MKFTEFSAILVYPFVRDDEEDLELASLKNGYEHDLDLNFLVSACIVSNRGSGSHISASSTVPTPQSHPCDWLLCREWVRKSGVCQCGRMERRPRL